MATILIRHFDMHVNIDISKHYRVLCHAHLSVAYLTTLSVAERAVSDDRMFSE